MRARFAIIAAGALVCAAVPAVVTDQAVAQHTATVTLTTVTPRIDVNDQPTFRYSTTDVSPEGQVRLQELIGGVWTTVTTRLPGTDKTIRAPAVTSIGKYTYRMRAFDGTPLHQVAQTAHNHDVYAYRNISIEKLCPHTIGSRICAKVKQNVGGTEVLTHMNIGSAVYPNYFAGAHFDRTSCRSAELIFTNEHHATANTYLKLTQHGVVRGSASTGHNKLGHLTATSMTNTELYFNGSTQGTPYSVNLDGTMSCWTNTGDF